MVLDLNKSNLKGKKILLGICGSIAAYKSVFLLRMLTKAGAEVKVIPTKDALTFVGESTWSALSSSSVKSSIQDEGAWNNHVEFGLWADLFVIAPATAQTIAKFTHGFADNLLSAVFLSARCPVIISPAMDLDMWLHPATQNNVDILSKRGTRVIPPAFGQLASGLTGEGRLPEPEDLFQLIDEALKAKGTMTGLQVMITGGPTVEAIDPVRYISNYSTGKMSIAIANELAKRGAEVHLISGPVTHQWTHPGVIITKVKSAEEMLAACKEVFDHCQISIFTAAVADYRPATNSLEKIKKNDDTLSLQLIKNPDIAAYFGKVKKADQITVGFALETNQELENAKLKLKAKHFDFLVLNSLRDEGAGFGTDTNKVTLLFPEKEDISLALQSKVSVASHIANEIEKHPKLKSD